MVKKALKKVVYTSEPKIRIVSHDFLQYTTRLYTASPLFSQRTILRSIASATSSMAVNVVSIKILWDTKHLIIVATEGFNLLFAH